MLKKFFISLLLLGSVQAFGKPNHLIDNPYSETRLHHLVHQFPQRFRLEDNNPLQMRYFQFYNKRWAKIAALSRQEKEAYYTLLQKLFSGEERSFHALNDMLLDIARFSEETGLGKIYTLYYADKIESNPLASAQYQLRGEYPVNEVAKPLFELSAKDRAQYISLREAVYHAEQRIKKDSSLQNYQALKIAKEELNKFELRVGFIQEFKERAPEWQFDKYWRWGKGPAIEGRSDEHWDGGEGPAMMEWQVFVREPDFKKKFSELSTAQKEEYRKLHAALDAAGAENMKSFSSSSFRTWMERRSALEKFEFEVGLGHFKIIEEAIPEE